MSPQPRTPARDAAKPAKAKKTRADAKKRSAPKPLPTLPGRVPLETGLSDYGMWVAMFTDTDIPPMPADRRRGRIWA